MEKSSQRKEINRLFSSCLFQNEALIVEIEVAFTRGLPGFNIVGLAGESIRESKDRCKAALSYIGYQFPPLKVVISLIPADKQKIGSHFDLPIALLIALQKYTVLKKDFYIFGEIGLDGKIRETTTIFPTILSLRKNKKDIKVLVPKVIAEKISLIPDVEVYGVEDLEEAIDFLTEKKEIIRSNKLDLSYKNLTINNQKYFYIENFLLDFKEVKNQKNAIRAAIISVAGFHNIIFEGSPGCGKSMIAKRMPYVLPPMTLDEMLEKSKYDLFDEKEFVISPNRNFRSPHHTSTKASIFGGGSSNAKIGEVALSNNGILFFDELPHFPKMILEALREPLEDYKILISRVNSKIDYDANFLFVGAMNPCPCGNLLSKTKECRCNDLEIKKYKNRLSEPFLDRIDLYVAMQESEFYDKSYLSSAQIFENVLKAFAMQKRRGQQNLNARLTQEDMSKYIKLDLILETFFNDSCQKLDISKRKRDKILKVARTIADLDESIEITKSHIVEAFGYRKRD